MCGSKGHGELDHDLCLQGHLLGPERGHFWPQGYNLNNLGRGPLGEAKYQLSKAPVFWRQIRRFLKVFSICLCKTCGPQGGAIFDPRVIT